MDINKISGLALFRDTGRIVCGPRFVGREDEVQYLTDAVLSTRANTAVIGMPRIGKSSLVWHALMHRREEIFSRDRIVCVYVDCSTTDTKVNFFRLIIRQLQKEIMRLCRRNPDLSPGLDTFATDTLEKFLDENVDAGNSKFDNDFRIIFEDLKYIYDIGVVVILDEFDKVEAYLETPGFLLLRETAYTPDTNLSYVTVSRKAISEIEAKHSSVSNFHGTFSRYVFLNVFSDKDMKAYWHRLSTNGVNISDADKKEIIYVSGCHPLFLDVCCENVVGRQDSHLLDDPNIRQKLFDEFSQLINIMADRNVLSTIQQVVIGPALEFDSNEVKRLEDFGFLRAVNNKYKAQLLFSYVVDDDADSKVYVLFSDYFTKLFFAKYYLTTAYWPQWAETEDMLRKLIVTFLKDRYGEGWIPVIRKENRNDSKWLDSFDTMINRYEANQRTYFNASLHSPLSFAETGEMYTLFIKRYWALWFSQVFDDIKDNEMSYVNTIAKFNTNWSEIFAFLMKVRRPYAHTNTYVLSEEDKLIAKHYCGIVKTKILAAKGKTPKAPAYNAAVDDVSLTLQHGREYRGVIVADRNNPNKYKVKCSQLDISLNIVGPEATKFNPGVKVTFKANSAPDRFDPNKTFWTATNLKIDFS